MVFLSVYPFIFLNLYRNSDSSNPFGLDRKRAKGFRTILMFKQASIAIYVA